ncbi:MAG: hypothetical protein JWQ98_3116 [Chlorobi bacterium]|jgi:hypothetical protein|nr:hypothetical protein [Chlorobiota bacterium]
MKSFSSVAAATIISLAVFLAGSGCAHVTTADPTAVPEFHGMIHHVGSTMYAIIPDSDRNTRYAPDSLPPEFRVDSLRVVFSGTARAMSDNARYWGVPFTLASIRRE